METRILIVGTVPYNEQSTSRAFNTYFCNYEHNQLAQIFSNNRIPCKGHCETIYQITDSSLLKRRFSKKQQVGKIYNYDELPDTWNETNIVKQNKILDKLYAIGKRKTPINYLMRKALWNKKYWNTPQLNKWLEDFNPTIVFLSFSDDFFIPEIALYVSEKFNIPILSSIGDDYYFNDKFSIDPFYHIYRHKYKKLIDKVMKRGSAIYIGDKIKNKYNNYFSIDGETIFLTSAIESKNFTAINTINPLISYCGNIRIGRNESIVKIAKALYMINSNYIINVYSNEKDNKYIKPLLKEKNIRFLGQTSYENVKETTRKSDFVLVVEGERKKDVYWSRYSLSTKVADSLASNSLIISYGSLECGAIEYLANSGACIYGKSVEELAENLKNVLNNVNSQRTLFSKSQELYLNNHLMSVNNKRFMQLVERVENNEKRFNDDN